MRIIAIIKSNCKKNSQPEKHPESQFGCPPTLVLSPTMQIELGNSNETSAKLAVHIYYQYAKSEHGTIIHIVFGVCILFCILKDIYAE